jgi:hypothetical protein
MIDGQGESIMAATETFRAPKHKASHSTRIYHMSRETRRLVHEFAPTPWQKQVISTLARKDAGNDLLVKEIEDDLEDLSPLEVVVVHVVYEKESLYRKGFTSRLASLLRSFVRR